MNEDTDGPLQSCIYIGIGVSGLSDRSRKDFALPVWYVPTF